MPFDLKSKVMSDGDIALFLTKEEAQALVNVAYAVGDMPAVRTSNPLVYEVVQALLDTGLVKEQT